MKKQRLTGEYWVPHWGFCNSDNFTKTFDMTNQRCRFCVKEGKTYRCALHDVVLTTSPNGKQPLINKCDECGCAVNEDEPEQIHVNPSDIIAYALDSYTKTYNQLIAQGYPSQIAMKVARKNVLEN